VYSLLNTTDSELLNINGVGEKTVAKINEQITSLDQKNYSIGETEDGEYELESWPLRGERRKTIRTAEAILQIFRKKEHFGHHRKIADRLTGWAHDQRDDGFESVNEELCKQMYNLSPHELNTGILFDKNETYASIDKLIETIDSTTQKARAIIKFCADTDRTSVIEQAQTEVLNSIKEKEAARKEQRKQEKQAKAFLENPPELVNGWEHVPTPAEDVIAYNGQFQDRNCVVALFDTGDYISIRAFEHEKWETIDWSVELIGTALDNTRSHGTANFPETILEGAQDMIEFLNKDRFEFTPDQIPDPHYPCQPN
jgi:hypothetical protein